MKTSELFPIETDKSVSEWLKRVIPRAPSDDRPSNVYSWDEIKTILPDEPPFPGVTWMTWTTEGVTTRDALCGDGGDA